MFGQENRQKLDIAIEYHNSRRLKEAGDIYKEVIAEDPANFSALNLYGILLCQSGHNVEGINYIKKAIAISPSAYFYKNLATILTGLQQYDEAMQYLLKADALEPNDVATLFNLAIVYKNKNLLTESIEYYQKALVFAPENSSILYNLANVYVELKDYEKAIGFYKKALTVNPNDVDILKAIAFTYKKDNKLDLALKYLQKAIDLNPNDDQLYICVAMLFADQERYNDALEMYKKALEFNSANIEIYIATANILSLNKEYTEAVKYLETAININPNSPELYNNLGIALFDLNKPAIAVEVFEKAIYLSPENSHFCVNISNCYKKMRHLDKAEFYLKKAIELDVNNASAYNNLGLICYEENRFEEAFGYYEKALNLQPNEYRIYLNLSNLSYLLGNMKKSIWYLDKILELDPDNVSAHFNKSHIYLLNEKFEEGWKFYEWRIKCENDPNLVYPQLSKPVWDGSSLKDKILYVYYEQGFGDSIQFVRFLPTLAKTAKKVIFKVQNELLDLFKLSNFNAEVIGADVPDESIDYDVHVPLMSILDRLNINLTNIPYSKGYLKADEDKVKAFKKEYFQDKKLKIGIKWQGTFNGNQNRKIPLKAFYPLANLKDVSLYSFQKGYGEEQLKDMPHGININDLSPLFNTFSDTAAAIECMDLIICNDTSIAHLAGALGKKTWLLLPQIPEWRWVLNRNDTPWYDSIHLFRQKNPGDWDEVIKEVVKELSLIL